MKDGVLTIDEITCFIDMTSDTWERMYNRCPSLHKFNLNEVKADLLAVRYCCSMCYVLLSRATSTQYSDLFFVQSDGSAECEMNSYIEDSLKTFVNCVEDIRSLNRHSKVIRDDSLYCRVRNIVVVLVQVIGSLCANIKTSLSDLIRVAKSHPEMLLEWGSLISNYSSEYICEYSKPDDILFCRNLLIEIMRKEYNAILSR